MDPKALKKAQLRLGVATENAEALKAATTMQKFDEKWYIFLHAAKGVYTTLKEGAKASPQSRQWFGQANEFRKNDELLRYIWEARNDDEHGIEEQTERVPPSLLLGISENGSSRFMQDQYGNILGNVSVSAYQLRGPIPKASKMPVLTALDGKPVRSSYQPDRVVLRPVLDRSNVQYNPPKTHLGVPLKTDTALEVAELTVKYLRRLVGEAEDFCKP
jgi:hypothetical protein